MCPKKVLVVEDERAIQELLNWVLRHAGFEVSIAKDGREALLLFERDQPDAVLLDLNLPVMRGEQVIHELRAIRTVPILVMTGAALFISELMQRAPDVQGYFLKPLDLAGVVSTLKGVLHIAEGSRRTSTSLR